MTQELSQSITALLHHTLSISARGLLHVYTHNMTPHLDYLSLCVKPPYTRIASRTGGRSISRPEGPRMGARIAVGFLKLSVDASECL